MASKLASLPKMDRVLQTEPLASHRSRRDLKKRVIETLLADARVRLKQDEAGEAPDLEAIAAAATRELDRLLVPRPRRVINATGVLLHTNLGRAPWPEAAKQAALEAAGSCDLELDLDSGERSSRFAHLRPLLAALLAAEDVHVVNNNAAALVLACAALGEPGGVALSIGQMLEIGDGFRVADMAAAAGTRVLPVGSTNRTHASDYEAAFDRESLARPASAILWVHQSNFSQHGFVHQVGLAELALIARGHGVPLIADLGSGSLGGLPGEEPSIGDYLGDGADVVLASGDKLLGGPQAGIIAGTRKFVDRCRKHPLARALRPDKTSLAALHATLALHAQQRQSELPLHAMAEVTVEQLASRARNIAAKLGWGEASLQSSRATLGGGSLPGQTIASVALIVPSSRPSASARRLRQGDPPVLGRIEAEHLLLDLRSVSPQDDEVLVAVLRKQLG